MACDCSLWSEDMADVIEITTMHASPSLHKTAWLLQHPLQYLSKNEAHTAMQKRTLDKLVDQPL